MGIILTNVRKLLRNGETQHSQKVLRLNGITSPVCSEQSIPLLNSWSIRLLAGNGSTVTWNPSEKKIKTQYLNIEIMTKQSTKSLLFTEKIKLDPKTKATTTTKRLDKKWTFNDRTDDRKKEAMQSDRYCICYDERLKSQQRNDWISKRIFR